MSDPNSDPEPETFGFELEWPTGTLDEPLSVAVRSEEEAAGPPTKAVNMAALAEHDTADVIAQLAAAQLHGMEKAMAMIAARVDVLSQSTATFGSTVAERLSEHAQRLARLVAERDAAAGARWQQQQDDLALQAGRIDRAMAAIDELAVQVQDVLARVAEQQDEFAKVQEALQQEFSAIRRRLPVRAAGREKAPGERATARRTPSTGASSS